MLHSPLIMLVIKNGSQQSTNTPTTIPKVLAAFFSLLNLVYFRDIEMGLILRPLDEVILFSSPLDCEFTKKP